MCQTSLSWYLSSRGEQDRFLSLVPLPSSGQPSGWKCTNKLNNVTSSGVHSLGEIKQHVVTEDCRGRMTLTASLRGEFTGGEPWARRRSHSHGHWWEELQIRGKSNHECRGKCEREGCIERKPVWVEQSESGMDARTGGQSWGKAASWDFRHWPGAPLGCGSRIEIWTGTSMAFMVCVHCAGQTTMEPCQLQENPATLDSGHTVLTLRTWHGTGLQKPRERPGAEWPDFMAMENGPSLPFSHRDPYESALPVQRLSRVWG